MEIKGFFKEYHFLSNFELCRNGVEYEGIRYPSSEHAYQAAKTLDPEKRKEFIYGSSGQAKRKGKSKQKGGIIDLRPDWEEAKINIMRDILRAKFTQNSDLKEKLLATGDAYLEESNYWGDRFWGVDGHGLNWLGKLLMELRTELKNDQKPT